MTGAVPQLSLSRQHLSSKEAWSLLNARMQNASAAVSGQEGSQRIDSSSFVFLAKSSVGLAGSEDVDNKITQISLQTIRGLLGATQLLAQTANASLWARNLHSATH